MNMKWKYVLFFIRPINDIEKKQASYSVVECNGEKREVTVKERLGVNPNTKTFFFDHVFPPASKQIDLYKKVVTPIIDEVLLGYNCTIFAYVTNIIIFITFVMISLHYSS